MFLDSQKPVVLFAGEEVEVLEQNACRLFSTLDHLGALAKGEPFSSVRLISECTGTLVVATEEENEDVLRRFSHLGYMLHVDTSEQIPSARSVDKVVKRPMLLGEPVEAQGVPQAYLDGRFLPEEYPEAYQQARAFWSIGRSDRAIKILKEKCKTSQNPLDHYHLGCLLVFELKHFSEGMEALWRARQLSPEALAPLLALAMALVMQDKPEETLPLLEEAEKRASDNEKKREGNDTEIWLHLARLYQSSNHPKRAYRAALRAFAQDLDNMEAKALLQKLEAGMFGPLKARWRRLLYAVSDAAKKHLKRWLKK
jgi:tetratricopeptide (TPR) repeat protein